MIKEENKQYKEALRGMWARCFHDTGPYMDFYFDEIYGINDVLIHQEPDGTISGMLHRNPYTLLVEGEPYGAHYLVGIATEEDYRRQGIMHRLLTRTMKDLRRQGEFLTYLMPAREEYYLPFGFRFGGDWLEWELLYAPSPGKADIKVTETPEDAALCAALENQSCKKLYDICTGFSPDYYACLEKETRSEFAKVFYVYEDGQYAGRFVTEVGEDYMILYRIVCCQEDRTDFLKKVLDYCRGRYHYRQFQIISDGTWESVCPLFHDMEGIRVRTIRRIPRIMFRILNLEKAGRLLRTGSGKSLRLYVRDPLLPEQEGFYYIHSCPTGSVITRDRDPEQNNPPADGGEISIDDLTGLVFGRPFPERTTEGPPLTEEGRAFMDSLLPVKNVAVMEYI